MSSLAATADASLHVKVGTLPPAARKEFTFRRDIIAPLLADPKNANRRLLEIATQPGARPYKTMRRWYDQAKKGGLAALINKSLAGPDWWASQERVGLPDEDKKLVKTYTENNQRNTEQALKDLRKDWLNGRVRTEQPIDPRTGYPRGWSIDNLRNHVPSKYELKSIRLGSRAASGLAAQVFSSRVGLWPHSHIMFDDVWHDHFVRVGDRGQVGRVLELGALDVFSGCRFSFGSKPRLKDEDGKNEGLKKQNMLLLIAAGLWGWGYHPERGTCLMGEHGTAMINDRAAQILFDATEGKITRRESGITGEEQALLGGWRGEGKGNPRFKAPLEVVHRIMHDINATLPGQAGKDRDHRPETTHGILNYCDELHELAKRIGPERAALLMFPVLEYHSQWLPLAIVANNELNARTQHNLEGWTQLGHFTNIYRQDARIEDWISEQQFLALPPDQRLAITHAVRLAPALHSRTRKLSPADVHTRGTAQLRRIPPFAVCQLLEEHFTREGERVDGAYFVFEDKEISLERLIYKARIKDLEGHERELRDGDRYNVLVNPFDPECLFVMDARNRYLGIADRVQRISRADDSALPAAYGEKAKRNAERLTEVRERHQEDTNHIAQMRKHNKRVEEGGPMNPQEKKEAKDATTHRRSRFAAEAARAAEILSEHRD